jgi:hypothetical protein
MRPDDTKGDTGESPYHDLSFALISKHVFFEGHTASTCTLARLALWCHIYCTLWSLLLSLLDPSILVHLSIQSNPM